MNDSLFFMFILAAGALFFRSRIRKAMEQYRKSEGQSDQSASTRPVKPQMKKEQQHQKAQAPQYAEVPVAFGAEYQQASEMAYAEGAFTSSDDQFFSRSADFHQNASLEGKEREKTQEVFARPLRAKGDKKETAASPLPVFSDNPLVQAVIMKEVLTRRLPGKPRHRG